MGEGPPPPDATCPTRFEHHRCGKQSKQEKKTFSLRDACTERVYLFFIQRPLLSKNLLVVYILQRHGTRTWLAKSPQLQDGNLSLNPIPSIYVVSEDNFPFVPFLSVCFFSFLELKYTFNFIYNVTETYKDETLQILEVQMIKWNILI